MTKLHHFGSGAFFGAILGSFGVYLYSMVA
jgi:hypothetical protein